jgi:exonuclease III
VLVFNVEYGGDLVDFAKTAEAIELSSPDVVAIEEAWGHIPRLADALGFAEYDLRHHVLSRLPLLDSPDGDGRVVFFETSPGCAVALANVHLPSDPPIEEVLHEGGPERAFEVERNSRLRALEPTLASLRALAEQGMPVLLAGDFNTLSHLDDGLSWPTSRAVAHSGLRDAWREVHPDPKTHPGFTWWAGRPSVDGWNPGADSPQSRIDRLYSGGPIRVKDARIVGEAGREGVAIGITPWPSDHRALLVALELTPAPTPTTIAAWPERVFAGEEFRTRARGFPPRSTVAVVRGEGANARPIASREAAMADLVFPTTGLEGGAYEVLLLDSSGARIERTEVFLYPAETPPALRLDPELAPGEPIEVRFSGAPGNRWDWIGVYREGSDLNRDAPLLWRHTGARVQGEMVLDEGAEGGGWPLPSGAYRLYLCEDDSYRALASVPFDVK